jgi:hypothetical protein
MTQASYPTIEPLPYRISLEEKLKFLKESTMFLPDWVDPEDKFSQPEKFMEEDLEVHTGGWTEIQIHGLPTDLSYQSNYVPFDQLFPLYVSENQILDDVIKHTQKPGIKNHHPAVSQVVIQSLEEIPELQQLYLQS